jgi:hypothetical protein
MPGLHVPPKNYPTSAFFSSNSLTAYLALVNWLDVANYFTRKYRLRPKGWFVAIRFRRIGEKRSTWAKSRGLDTGF